jgi:hypothetical protein
MRGLSAHPRAELRGRDRGAPRGSRGAAGQQGSRRGQVARLLLRGALRGALGAPAEGALERAAVAGCARAAARAVHARAVWAPEDLAPRRTVDVEEQPDLACPGHGRGRKIRQGRDLLRPRDCRALSRRALRGRNAFEPCEKGAQTAQQSSRGRKCDLAPAPGGVHLQEEAGAPAPPQSRPAERAGRRGLHRRAVRERLADEAAQTLAHRRRDAVVPGPAALQPGAEGLRHGVNDQVLRRAARASTEVGRSDCFCAGGGRNAFLGARE